MTQHTLSAITALMILERGNLSLGWRIFIALMFVGSFFFAYKEESALKKRISELETKVRLLKK